jgi:hypothetical protein
VPVSRRLPSLPGLTRQSIIAEKFFVDGCPGHLARRRVSRFARA